jgi:hypothetical protein
MRHVLVLGSSLVSMLLLASCATGVDGEGSIPVPRINGGSGKDSGSGLPLGGDDAGDPRDPGTADAGSPPVDPAPPSGGTSSTPTSCTDVGTKGCCSSDGTTNYYCSKSAVKTAVCAAGTTCGWDSAKSWYGCVSGTGSADPKGTYPMACGSSGGGTSSSTTCSDCESTAFGTGGTCATAAKACGTACQALIKCINACAPTDTACSSACSKTAGSTAVSQLDSMVTCVCTKGCVSDCKTECGG